MNSMHTCIQLIFIQSMTYRGSNQLCQFVTYSCSAWHCILCMLLVLWLLQCHARKLKDSIGIVSFFKLLGNELVNRSVQVTFGTFSQFTSKQCNYSIQQSDTIVTTDSTLVYTFANSVFLVAVYKRSSYFYCHGFPGGFDLPHAFYHC